MVRHSDNVMAEAIARELAMARGKEASFEGDTQATLEVLREQGFDVEGVDIKDNSGLSVDNRLTAGLLTQLINGAVKDPRLRPLVSYLPVAGGDGKLYERYGDSAAKGYVRAKTGTLTGRKDFLPTQRRLCLRSACTISNALLLAPSPKTAI